MEKFMPLRGDEVTDRIEARVREAVERLVGEIRTSIDDVRDAIDQQLKAAVQSVQADMKSLSFRAEVEEEVKGLEESLRSPAPPASAVSPSSIRQALAAVESGKNQVEVLTALLDQCLGLGSRAALLILRADGFAGWKGAGFTLHGGNDDAVKRFSAPAGKIPELSQMTSEERMISCDGTSIVEQMGGKVPDVAVFIPMVIKDKIAAAVYVDAIGEDTAKFDPAALQVLVFATGMLVDTLAIRRNHPSPSLRGETLPRDNRPVAGPASRGISTGEVATNRDAEARSEQTMAIPARQIREMLAASAAAAAEKSSAEQSSAESEGRSPESPAQQDSRPMSVETSTIARVAIPPSSPAAPEDSFTPAQDPADRPSTQYIPPPGLTRRAGFAFSGDDSERKHDEARRFARLLVSEIKLYNESQIEQGRRERDIYERLKEDIDRSRQIYDERVPDDVRKDTNYYYDELVRILADGSSEALGI
ncbi:MAG: hypothetical protein ABI718_06025 [Acidobacteriota bacterium]